MDQWNCDTRCSNLFQHLPISIALSTTISVNDVHYTVLYSSIQQYTSLQQVPWTKWQSWLDLSIQGRRHLWKARACKSDIVRFHDGCCMHRWIYIYLHCRTQFQSHSSNRSNDMICRRSNARRWVELWVGSWRSLVQFFVLRLCWIRALGTWNPHMLLLEIILYILHIMWSCSSSETSAETCWNMLKLFLPETYCSRP